MKSGIAPYLPKDVLEAALNAQRDCLHGKRDQAILMLSHYMGLRAMELAALTLGDVYDFNTGKIKETVRLLPTMTKGKRFREVFLVNDKAREVLRLYLTTRSLRHADAPLFLSQRGGRFSANTLQRLIAIAYQRAGIMASSHSGRRSFATNLLESGANIYVIQQLLGHSSIMTTQAYFTASTERLKKAVGSLQ